MNIAARKRSALNRAPMRTSATDIIVAGLIAVTGLCGALGVKQAHGARVADHNAAPIAHNMPKSRKHIRITYHAFNVSIAYYGHNGRKITRRNGVSFSDLPKIINAARARGYSKA